MVALAAAHSIDLGHVAGIASDTHGIAKKRQRTKAERRENIPIRDTVTGRESRIYRRPAWTHADLGFCAAGGSMRAADGREVYRADRGVPRMPWLAVCYSYAGDSTGYPELHRGLMREGLKIATREGWAMYERDRAGQKRYAPIAELASVVLDADAHPAIFAAAPLLFAVCLNVPDEIWSTRYESRYRTLKDQYERWLAIARGIIGRWITECDTDHSSTRMTNAA